MKKNYIGYHRTKSVLGDSSRNHHLLIALLIVLLLNVISSKGQNINIAPIFNSGTTAGLSAGQAGASKNINRLLEASDTDQGQLLTWSIVSPPTIGTLIGFPAFALSGNAAARPDHNLFYQPTPGRIGADEFIIKISDGIDSSTVKINVALLWVEPPSNPNFGDFSEFTPGDPNRNITTVEQWINLQVPFGTTYSDLALPVDAGVTYVNGGTERLSVSWYSSNFNGLVSRDYLLIGDLLLSSGGLNVMYIKAQIIVTVLPNLQPTEIILSDSILGAYPFEDPEFPPNVFTTNDADDDIHTYYLVDGTGSEDNCKFYVGGGTLRLEENANPDNQTEFSIRVRSTDSNNNFIEQEFMVYLKGNGKEEVKTVEVPNAFSPNGDGINDLWIIPELKEYENVDIKVFDRSGALMFHSSNPTQGWDGRNPNGRIIAGVYFYMIKVGEINLKKQGVLILITN